MALDPAILAQPGQYPRQPVQADFANPVQQRAPLPAEPDALQEATNSRQVAYQQVRAAVTERERWGSLDRITLQAQQALASALELVLRLEKQVQALEARQVALASPVVQAPAVQTVQALPPSPAPSEAQAPAERVETVGLYQQVEHPGQSEPLSPTVPGAAQVSGARPVFPPLVVPLAPVPLPLPDAPLQP